MNFIYLLPLFLFIGISLYSYKSNNKYYKKDYSLPHTFADTDSVTNNRIDFDRLYK